jgi:hypothetical protein
MRRIVSDVVVVVVGKVATHDSSIVVNARTTRDPGGGKGVIQR